MKQGEKLKLTNWSLLVMTVVITASGVQLEVMHGEGKGWVIAHIVEGVAFLLLCGYHVFLHFKWNNWFARFSKLKSQATRILWWVSLLTFLTGVIAVFRWLTLSAHTVIGGVHGKISFLMIFLAVFHVLNRRKFYQKQSKI